MNWRQIKNLIIYPRIYRTYRIPINSSVKFFASAGVSILYYNFAFLLTCNSFTEGTPVLDISLDTSMSYSIGASFEAGVYRDTD